jgi:DNA polymerase III psi subunit
MEDDSGHHWVALVLPGEQKGEYVRVELADLTRDWAARRMIWQQLIHDPASTLDVRGMP